MILLEKPVDFRPKFEIVSVFAEHKGKFVLLYRNGNKPQPNTWGVPAGKVEKGEDLRQAMLREMKQETGILLDSNQIHYYNKVYVRYPDYDFVYHIFHAKLKANEIKINSEEHKDFTWVAPEEALNMPLIQDLDNCIRLFYSVA